MQAQDAGRIAVRVRHGQGKIDKAQRFTLASTQQVGQKNCIVDVAGEATGQPTPEPWALADILPNQ